MKIVLSLLAVIVLVVCSAGYVAGVGVKVDATNSNLVGRWTNTKRGTTITLNADGTFTATGINECGGPVQAVVDGDTIPSLLDVSSGEGTWNVTPDTNNPGVNTFLNMTFRSPKSFTLRWITSNVTWQFRSTEVTLTRSNPTQDATQVACTFEAVAS